MNLDELLFVISFYISASGLDLIFFSREGRFFKKKLKICRPFFSPTKLSFRELPENYKDPIRTIFCAVGKFLWKNWPKRRF